MGKIATGVKGLDQMLEGGFMDKSVNVLSGTPGTGKTIFGMQFLVEGALKGERGIYVSLEQPIADITTSLQGFEWDVGKLSKEGKIKLQQFKIGDFSLTQFEEVITKDKNIRPPTPPSLADLYFAVKDSVEKKEYKRIVIDSISMIEYKQETEQAHRVQLMSLFKALKDSNMTSVLIVERDSAEEKFEFEDFVADSVLILRDYPGKQERKRGLTILKARGIKCDRTTRPYVIHNKGLEIYATEHML